MHWHRDYPCGYFPGPSGVPDHRNFGNCFVFSVLFKKRDTVWEWWTNQFQAPVTELSRSYLSALGEEHDVYADMFVAQTVADKEPAAPNKNRSSNHTQPYSRDYYPSI